LGSVCSVGYQGFDLVGFTACMEGALVDLVVDVRLHPVSRQPGFSKRQLAEALAAAGIGYVHEPTLGNPPDNRPGMRRADAAARERMQAIVDQQGHEALLRLLDLARDQRVAVLCVERDPALCHRTIVIDALARLDPGLRVDVVRSG